MGAIVAPVVLSEDAMFVAEEATLAESAILFTEEEIAAILALVRVMAPLDSLLSQLSLVMRVGTHLNVITSSSLQPLVAKLVLIVPVRIELDRYVSRDHRALMTKLLDMIANYLGSHLVLS